MPKATAFFFQAEDGIRDIGVTGVQTCALPIYLPPRYESRPGAPHADRHVARTAPADWRARSEERRVGKECRSRCAPSHLTKKKQTIPQHAPKTSDTPTYSGRHRRMYTGPSAL